jgi:toxin ParE1/3/4
MGRLNISQHAQADFAAIIEYLAKEAGMWVARDYREQIRAFYRLLRDHPEIGAPRPRLGRNIRVGVVRPYLVIYRYAGEGVTVLRIVHGRRKLAGTMLRKGG